MTQAQTLLLAQTPVEQQRVFSRINPTPREYELVKYLVLLRLSAKTEQIKALYEVVVKDKPLTRVADKYLIPKETLRKIRLNAESSLTSYPPPLRILALKKYLREYYDAILSLKPFYDRYYGVCMLCNQRVTQRLVSIHIMSKHEGIYMTLVDKVIEEVRGGKTRH